MVILVIASLMVLGGCSSREEKEDDDFSPEAFDIYIAEDYTLAGKCSGITSFGAAAIGNSDNSLYDCR